MLHELLTGYRDEIIRRCERKLLTRHPNRSTGVVVDTIPQFIDELIKAERREAGIPEDTPLPLHIPFAKEHGAQRFHNGFKISDIAQDYGMISDAIGEIAIEQDFSLDPRSYKLMNECIDRAIAESLDQYYRLDEESDAQSIAQWIGSLGHELRNAVGSALMAYTVLQTGQVGIQSRTARVLERSLRRMEALVTQTLTAAKLRVAKEIIRQEIYLKTLVDDIVAGLPNPRGIQVHNIIEHSFLVRADPDLLESAFTNLIQNAIKFTRDGGHVDIRAGAMDTGSVLQVEDECGGLGEQDAQQLFGAFVQGDARDGGVGLGLSIVRQAIEAHGGHVDVTDLAPKGCVFSVFLPH